jgi:putative addiction module component (TIGR02574 family)
MTPTLANILQLSVAERIQLVEDIWDSILTTPETLPVTAAQRQELDRRIEAYQQSPETSIPWAEAKKRIRKKQ